MSTIILEKEYVFININPAIGEEINKLPLMNKEQVEELMLKTKEYFPVWSSYSIKKE